MSETNVSGRPCLLNSRLRTAIVEQVSAFCIGKISGRLNWSSTTTKKLLIRPAKFTCNLDPGYPGCLDRKTDVADGLSVGIASVCVPRPRSSVKTVEKRLIISISSVIALWTGNLKTALQTKLSGISWRSRDSIKSRTNWLCLESAM